jgi:hypothetical protein
MEQHCQDLVELHQRSSFPAIPTSRFEHAADLRDFALDRWILSQQLVCNIEVT